LSKRLIVLFAGVLAIAIAAAGCGGSSSDSSDTTASAALTKAELIKQGDAICEKGNKAIEKEAEEFADENNVDTENPTAAQQEEVIVDVVAPGVRRQVEEIGDLTPPSGDEAKIEAMVAAVEEGTKAMESDPTTLIEGTNPLGKGSKLARSYGFTECGEE
jgi:ABC-type glycerol-3-phosphate transport system substrate-binding protein